MRKRNRYGYTGIYFDRVRGKFGARITHQGKTHYLGWFEHPWLAGAAYDKKKEELQKEA